MKDWRLFICQYRIGSPDFSVSELSYRVPCSSHLCPLSSKHILCDQHIYGPTGHACPLLENHVVHSPNKDTENYYNVYLQNCFDVSWPLKHFSQIKSFLISTYCIKLPYSPKWLKKGEEKSEYLLDFQSDCLRRHKILIYPENVLHLVIEGCPLKYRDTLSSSQPLCLAV